MMCEAVVRKLLPAESGSVCGKHALCSARYILLRGFEHVVTPLRVRQGFHFVKLPGGL
jgi:hypothetical protein